MQCQGRASTTTLFLGLCSYYTKYRTFVKPWNIKFWKKKPQRKPGLCLSNSGAANTVKNINEGAAAGCLVAGWLVQAWILLLAEARWTW